MTTDPRDVPGSIAGPGGPHDRRSVILDARRAVLLDSVNVCMIEPEQGARGQKGAAAMALAGRINQTTEHAEILFLFGTDGAASIVAELIALFGRATGSTKPFMDDVTARLRKLANEGNLA
jgi:hypothetical protein